MKAISNFIALFCIGLFLALPVMAADMKISNIRYEGNERISSETIFAYLEIIPGQKFSEEQVDKSLKALFNTGFFSDVKINLEGTTLVVNVKENPLISKVAFDGNKRLEDKDLLPELSLKSNTVFSPYKLSNDIARIITLYEKIGRYSVKVVPKQIKLDSNRINLVYEINEGVQASIQKIRFIGNDQIASSDLVDVIASKEYRFYRFFSNADVYDPEKLEYDKEMLKRYYQSKGFAAFKVVSGTAEISPNREAFVITFILDEGKIYDFGNIDIESNVKNLDSENLRPLLKITSGSRFNKDLIDKSVDEITNYLGNHGYPFVEVDPVINTFEGSALADVKFVVKESHKVFINRINIKNNIRTLDKVIRREFRINEGDPYNLSKIQRSKQRIENLGYFAKADFKNQTTSDPDKIDLDIEVEEQSTGSIHFAGGYNTATGVLGQIMLTENNFLGKGQQVQVGTTFAQKESSIGFGFTEPYFMDRDISAGFDVFASKRDYKSISSYKSKTVGFGLRSGYEITENWSHGVRYALKKESVTDISKNASIYVKDEAGTKVVSSVGQTIAYETLDNRLYPSEGFLIKLEQDVAGLGGYTRYFSNRLVGAYYHPVIAKDVVFKAVLRGGHITGFGGREVRLNDRFYIGPEYIRGFDVAGIGPRDKNTGDALGGKTYYTGTTELIFPVGLPNEVGLKGAIFHDFGSLFGIDARRNKKDIVSSHAIRASYGMSLIWKSPLGTINLNYGIPYRKESFDDVKKFYIDFGTNF